MLGRSEKERGTFSSRCRGSRCGLEKSLTVTGAFRMLTAWCIEMLRSCAQRTQDRLCVTHELKSRSGLSSHSTFNSFPWYCPQHSVCSRPVGAVWWPGHLVRQGKVV